MEKINSLDVSRMRMEEDFGFMKLVKAETVVLTAEDTKVVIADFNAAYAAFDEALKITTTLPSASVASDADRVRDRSWGFSNAYVNAMANHPTASVAEVARKAKALFDKYGNPTVLPQTEESGVLHNLIQDLKTLTDEELATIAYKPWLDDLEKCENQFLAAVKSRTEEEAERVKGVAREARMLMDDAYRKLVERVNALAVVNGPDAYAVFIDHVNALVERQRSVLKTRMAANAKKTKKAAE